MHFIQVGTSVFIVSFFALTLELIISRISAFYLNYSSSFMAIPIALFGLCLGSYHIQKLRNKTKTFCDIPIEKEIAKLFFSSVFAYLVVFISFSQIFPVTRYLVNAQAALKTILFSIAFLIPFYFVGRILSLVYSQFYTKIGYFYALDFLGAGLACLTTPILFHFFDLPVIILIQLFAISALWLFIKKIQIFWIPIIILNLFLFKVFSFAENSYDFSQIIKLRNASKIKQIAHRWNEYSRVALLQIEDAPIWYKIIHDNAESNVNIYPYQDNFLTPLKITINHIGAIPFFWQRTVKEALVMFAGCGQQMIELYDYSNRQAKIVGVEINPLVKKFATKTPALKNYNLQQFYNLPKIGFEIQEGRYFLETEKKQIRSNICCFRCSYIYV